MAREIVRTKNFVQDAAALIVQEARRALQERGECHIALSGGNTPRPVYSEVARADLPWSQILFTFGDERCVPPDDAQSNYRMARESLFDLAHVPASSILRMRGEIDPTTAASEYERELDAHVAQKHEAKFRHDLILLGMGDDGHTASLFPGTAALQEKERRVISNFVPKFNTYRLTFTFPFINAARHVCFLVNAAKNPELIEKVLAGDQQYPCARIQPADGKLTWILGQSA